MLSGLTMAMNAQDVYSENFNGNPNDIINEGWRFVEISGDPENFGVYSSTPAIENIGIEGGAMGVASFNIVNQVPTHVVGLDMAVVSPAITLPAGESHLHYRMGSAPIGGGASSNYSLYVLTKAEFEAVAANPAQVKSLLDARWADDSATIANEVQDNTTELTDFESQEIVIVFRMHNSPSNSILLFDNLRVTAGALGTGGFDIAQFTAYPNPASDIVNISGSGIAPIDIVTVTDINGRIVARTEFAGANAAQLDLSGLSNGVYIMAVSSGNATTTQKIVKQ